MVNQQDICVCLGGGGDARYVAQRNEIIVERVEGLVIQKGALRSRAGGVRGPGLAMLTAWLVDVPSCKSE